MGAAVSSRRSIVDVFEPRTGSVKRGAAALVLLLAILSASPPSEPPITGPRSPGDLARAQDLLRGVGHGYGDLEAPLLIVEFLDFGCAACAMFALNSFPTLRGELVETGRARWQVVPFDIGRFRHSTLAAVAAECAAEQDAFSAMHTRLFQAQREWSRERDPQTAFLGYARELGLDTGGFAQCYESSRHRDRIRQHGRLAQRMGVRGTPTFVVNGSLIMGALPPDRFIEFLPNR